MKRVFTPIFIDKAVTSILRMVSFNGQNGRIHTDIHITNTVDAQIANAILKIMENVAPELANTNQMKCKRARCKEIDLVLGEIQEQGQCIQIGNIRIWHIVRFSCTNCHKVYRFEPAPLNDLIPLDVLENEYGF